MKKNNTLAKDFNALEYVQNIINDEEKRQSNVMKELLVHTQSFKAAI
jgi:hypothetical protein